MSRHGDLERGHVGDRIDAWLNDSHDRTERIVFVRDRLQPPALARERLIGADF